MVLEINKATAISLIKQGDGYYSPHAHTPLVGKNGRTVVFVADRFFSCEKEDFTLDIHDVLRFDRGSMALAHKVECHNDDLGALLQAEVEQIVALAKDQSWVRTITDEVVPMSPHKKKNWYNRYYVELQETD